MKAEYRTTDHGESRGRTAGEPRGIDRRDSQALAAFLSGEGQALVPMLGLIGQAEMAVDELIDVAGRATIEAVLTLSALELAGPKHPGKNTGAAIGWPPRFQFPAVRWVDKHRAMPRKREAIVCHGVVKGAGKGLRLTVSREASGSVRGFLRVVMSVVSDVLAQGFRADIWTCGFGCKRPLSLFHLAPVVPVFRWIARCHDLPDAGASDRRSAAA